MAIVKPFRCVRPDEKYVDKVSCLPYDVMDRGEARKLGRDEKSFLHVIRSDMDFDDSVDIHDEKVYEKAGENYRLFKEKGYLKQEEKEVFLIYREIMDGRVQTGICGCCSSKEYEQGIIKKHELTRPEKEEDRINNFLACLAHTEPVFFAHRHDEKVHEFIENFTENNEPVYDFVAEDGIAHILWVVRNEEDINLIKDYYDGIDYLYIADGHHRTQSSYRVGKALREERGDNGEQEYDYILAVIFDSSELHVMDYNRVVKGLNGYSDEEFMKRIEKICDIVDLEGKEIRPEGKHKVSMYLKGKWYGLIFKDEIIDEEDPIKSLDADLLQENILRPLLGIDNPRTSDYIDFVGGIRGLKELEEKAVSYDGVAFALNPVSMDDLFKVADSGMTMPPKSTWFEPKLRSGLFIHEI